MTNRHSFKFLLTPVLALAAASCEKNSPYDNDPRVAARTDGIQRSVTTSPTANTMGTAPAVGHDHGAATGMLPGTAAATGTTDALSDGPKREADAAFKSVPNMKIKGDAELEEVAGGVHISVEVENAPTGQKGMHIHQTDNCSDIANKSMGEHFAPTIPKHGLPESSEHHLGDLGNITIDKDGKGKLEITVAGANLRPGDALSFVGRSIVLHESVDKGTGPSGDSGKPIACAPVRAD